MEDKTYGWTVEMQLKVLKQKCLMSKFLFAIKKNESEFQSVRNGKRKRDGRNKIIGWIFKYTFK
jgi:hypothetical protein